LIEPPTYDAAHSATTVTTNINPLSRFIDDLHAERNTVPRSTGKSLTCETTLRSSLRRRRDACGAKIVADNRSAFHDEFHALDFGHIGNRIPGHGNQVGKLPLFDRANLARPVVVQCAGRPDSNRL